MESFTSQVGITSWLQLMPASFAVKEKKLPQSILLTRKLCCPLRMKQTVEITKSLDSLPGITVGISVSQAAVPLVSFVTNLFSTFGFWLGLSVIGSLSRVQRISGTTVSSWRSLIWNEDGTNRLRRRRRMEETVQRAVTLFVRIHPRNNK